MKRVLACVLMLLACPAADAARYVDIPAGRFASVLPQGPAAEASTPVEIAAFSMRAAPVTVTEFAGFVRAHPQWQRDRIPALFAEARYLAGWETPVAPGRAQHPDAPVVDVSWFAAQAFCASEDARLPTWLEWEYVAAADETRTDARGDAAWRQRILAWYARPTAASLAPVGGPPNAYGVRDVHGLVWEWVDDVNALFIAGDSRTQGDPDLLQFCGAGAISIVDRDSYAVLMRIALLASLRAADTTGNLGFRCARAR